MKKIVRYTFYRFAKRIIRFFVAFSLIVSICFGSIFYHYEKVEAGAVVDVATTIGSLLGLANVTSGGSVMGMFAEQKQKIQTWWDDNVSHGGIYLDENNNYVFSGEATNALYEALDANSTTDAKVVSSFSETSLNVSPSFYTPLNSWRSENNIAWSDLLVFRSCAIKNESNRDVYWNYCKYIDLSGVSCLLLSLDSSSRLVLKFLDNNMHQVNVKSAYCKQVVYSNSGFNEPSFSAGGTQSQIYFARGAKNPQSSYLSSSEENSGIIWGGALDNNGYFINFPFSSDAVGSFDCDRSIIVCKNAVAGNSILNKKEGVFITNNYYGSQIPPISKTVFEENNWDSVYNSFINNINTNNENWYVDGEVDVQALRDEMSKQSNIIKEAIVQGNIDIADKIDYTNEWLKKIYNLLKEIKTLVANNQGGGGSSSTDLTGIEDQLDLVNTNFSELISKMDGVSSDLEDVLQALYSIESFCQSIDAKLDDLEQSYLVLSNIYSYMQSHPWGSGGGGGGPFITPTDDPWAPWFHYIDDDGANFPYGAILTKYNIIKTLIQGAAPYCFIAFIGGVLNSLEVEPVTPEFTIPVKSNGPIVQVDEELHFDLSGFEILLPYIHAMFIILFTVGLMWFSFPFIRNLIQIFDL